MSTLPVTWLETSLGTVTPYGTTFKAEIEEIMPDTWVLELEDIEKDTTKVLQRLTFAERQSKSTKNRFEAGDVLYGKLRPYLNKVTFADRSGVCSTEIVPIKPNEVVNGRYLFHWLRHPQFLSYVTEVSHGVNMPRLGTEAGRQAPFVLAPLNEQKCIADKLDTVLTRVDAVNARLARVAPILKRFRQSVLAAATSGRLTEDWRGAHDVKQLIWQELTIGTIASDLRYGTSKKCDYSETGTGVLRIPNIAENGNIDLSDLKRADFDQVELQKLSLRAGDILVIRSNGSVDLVGKVGVVDSTQEGLLFAGYLMRLRVNESMVLPRFAYISLTAPQQRVRIEQTAKSTSGVNNINSEELRGLPISLPPLDEQAEIVRRVETLFAFADRLEARLKAAQTATERLTPALLAKAFRGELVPQDPDDEPAAELLKRLAASQADRGTGSTRSRKKTGIVRHPATGDLHA